MFGKAARKDTKDAVQTRSAASVANASDTDNLLRTAARAIRDERFREARQLLGQAAAQNMENPEIFNLLGILYEKQSDLLNAGKFYRVAYYMDQSFKAASDNLDRVCQFWYRGSDKQIEWGVTF